MVLVYMFRQRGTDDLALTLDVTGRNIPPVKSSKDWLFVEAIDTLKFSPPWDIAAFQRQLRASGFYLLPAGWGAPATSMRRH